MVLSDQDSSVHRHLGSRGRRFVYLLYLMVVTVTLGAVAQTAQPFASHNLVGLDGPGAPAPSSRSVTEIGALDSGPPIESRGHSAPLVVIGFMGGFARSNDHGHPEVQFAEYLRDRYSSDIHAEVFGNHHGKKALHEIQRLLDDDGNGVLSLDEREQARIVIYGHSWGAAETVVLARELGKRGIPVLLTIQVDSIGKPGHDDSTIPSNVASAINLYQSRGPLHGRVSILAADPVHTKIIGNLHMTYEGRAINCDNYPWYARTFNKPHHEIENDPRVWRLAASLIDSEFAGSTFTAENSLSFELPGK